jgi:hypothetical protein
MRYSVMFWYIYSLCNDQLRILRLSIITSIYHSFVIRIFKTFSPSCFELYHTISLPKITLHVSRIPQHIPSI